MTRILALLFSLFATAAAAQTRDVDPADLTISVTVENAAVIPFQQEMVLITIHGIYRRHITREKLEQPDLAGFNWMQLGEDYWYDSQLDGLKVKNLRRRMALFPERPGTLDIGPFVHRLTLTDERDEWFEHTIRSEPISIEVAARPEGEGWWFPTRRLEISDRWSNAPDQLKPGDGVLRIIQLKAVGASPEMLPPMPDLTSPSAMIFPHPEKRFVELSPEGPVSFAFWRWTIRPSNDTSAIVEPITFDYFDTVNRQSHEVTISAQRVAMDVSELPDPVPPPDGAVLHAAITMPVAVLALVVGVTVLFLGRSYAGFGGFARWPIFDPLHRKLRRAARKGDLPDLRRSAAALLRRDGHDGRREELLRELDKAVFGRATGPAPRDFARRYLARSSRIVVFDDEA